ncbi:MAG: glucosaminidase domain-containing protein [Treponema sp.]|nr:glucosaminidase domain-containing protein [Treponema sp.]
MRKLVFFSMAIVLTGIFFSCTSKPAVKTPPEKLVVPPTPEDIMGHGLVKQEELALFLCENNADVEPGYARELAGYYIGEAAAEGVNHDVAFAQMCLETGYLRFGNLVTPDMNNFCGLGAMDAGHPGERFPDPETGVRAHIQHLKGYATEEPLNQALVDPRYRWVKKGSAPTIRGLPGKWAMDPNYDAKIGGILVRLYDFVAVRAMRERRQ